MKILLVDNEISKLKDIMSNENATEEDKDFCSKVITYLESHCIDAEFQIKI